MQTSSTSQSHNVHAFRRGLLLAALPFAVFMAWGMFRDNDGITPDTLSYWAYNIAAAYIEQLVIIMASWLGVKLLSRHKPIEVRQRALAYGFAAANALQIVGILYLLHLQSTGDGFALTGVIFVVPIALVSGLLVSSSSAAMLSRKV